MSEVMREKFGSENSPLITRHTLIFIFRPLNSNGSPNSYPYSLNLQIRRNNEWEPVLLRVPEKIKVSDKGKPYFQKIICKKIPDKVLRSQCGFASCTFSRFAVE
jgi:hypothetical protein